MPLELDNLTETLQRHLGLQQAQTFDPENITADAIARLTGRRGDLSRLLRMWESPAAARELVEGDEARGKELLSTLRRMLDSALVINTYKSGVPKSFRPFSPLLVSARRSDTIYRSMGRSVTEGLWARPGMEGVREGLGGPGRDPRLEGVGEGCGSALCR